MIADPSDSPTLARLRYEFRVAFSVPVEEPERYAYITNLYVHEVERGHGIGTPLLTPALAGWRELVEGK